MDVHPWMDKVENSCPKNHATVENSDPREYHADAVPALPLYLASNTVLIQQHNTPRANARDVRVVVPRASRQTARLGGEGF